MFQHTAARRRLGFIRSYRAFTTVFQHTAARRRLNSGMIRFKSYKKFQHTAARRRLVICLTQNGLHYCFNTQPPEGGWMRWLSRLRILSCFNTQPPEGGWTVKYPTELRRLFQHTAARRRLGASSAARIGATVVSTHSRPKAAALLSPKWAFYNRVSTHSRPKAADVGCYNKRAEMWFQHTAARRRLQT